MTNDTNCLVDAPALRRFSSFYRCGALLDYMEDQCCQKHGEGVTEYLGRLDALGSYFWREVAEWWCFMDGIEHENMALLFDAFSEQWSLDALSEKSRIMWRHLPSHKAITIFRGQDANHPVGLAWTTSQSKAEWFARCGMRGSGNVEPVVLTAQVWKGDVAFCFADRGESEVVPFHIPENYTSESLNASAKLAA